MHKEGKIFVPYILGEYTRKWHEYFTLIEITTTTSKEKLSMGKEEVTFIENTLFGALPMLPYLTFITTRGRV